MNERLNKAYQKVVAKNKKKQVVELEQEQCATGGQGDGFGGDISSIDIAPLDHEMLKANAQLEDFLDEDSMQLQK